MNLGEPQQREYEASGAQSEHEDNHLANPKVPLSVGKVRGNGCHEVDVSNNRQRKQRQQENRAKARKQPRTQEREPADLCHDERTGPRSPPSKCWNSRSDTHIDIWT